MSGATIVAQSIDRHRLMRALVDAIEDYQRACDAGREHDDAVLVACHAACERLGWEGAAELGRALDGTRGETT